ncbi:oligogalacturonate lyase family protein [Paenibacillus sp. HB172176]|uniref:oligogalacturonate lyase family protein n=1 Tax=Paenibacillus sp. HB172176 TaxID=2493690 RepID=UPI00143B16F0|nr:oligogalacturonate lyase family protein [Paenibacillus sp. HB172176]
MKGATVQHQVIERKDPETGKVVRQLTSLPGNHHHLYFTSSSFTADKKHILYISDDGSGNPNLYKLSIADGRAIQLTDNRNGIMRSYVYYDGNPNRGLAKASPSYNAESNNMLYIQDNEVRLIDVDTLEEKCLCRLPSHAMTGFTHLSSAGRLAAVPIIPAEAFRVPPGNPFSQIRMKVQEEGIASSMLQIDTETGHCDTLFRQVGWITHVQYHPQDSSQLLYNHEGGMVEQRIWLYDGETIQKIREQMPGPDSLWICHEMWSQQGQGVIYHGTSGIPNDPAMRELGRAEDEIVSFVGYYDRAAQRYDEVSFPPEMKAYGHFTSNSKDTLLVTDGVIDDASIHLIEPNWPGRSASWTKVCAHNSSFKVQDVHPHPIFSREDRYVLYTSDAHNEEGKGNIYLVEL